MPKPLWNWLALIPLSLLGSEGPVNQIGGQAGLFEPRNRWARSIRDYRLQARLMYSTARMQTLLQSDPGVSQPPEAISLLLQPFSAREAPFAFECRGSRGHGRRGAEGLLTWHTPLVLPRLRAGYWKHRGLEALTDWSGPEVHLGCQLRRIVWLTPRLPSFKSGFELSWRHYAYHAPRSQSVEFLSKQSDTALRFRLAKRIDCPVLRLPGYFTFKYRPLKDLTLNSLVGLETQLGSRWIAHYARPSTFECWALFNEGRAAGPLPIKLEEKTSTVVWIPRAAFQLSWRLPESPHYLGISLALQAVCRGSSDELRINLKLQGHYSAYSHPKAVYPMKEFWDIQSLFAEFPRRWEFWIPSGAALIDTYIRPELKDFPYPTASG